MTNLEPVDNLLEDTKEIIVNVDLKELEDTLTNLKESLDSDDQILKDIYEKLSEEPVVDEVPVVEEESLTEEEIEEIEKKKLQEQEISDLSQKYYLYQLENGTDHNEELQIKLDTLITELQFIKEQNEISNQADNVISFYGLVFIPLILIVYVGYKFMKFFI